MKNILLIGLALWAFGSKATSAIAARFTVGSITFKVNNTSPAGMQITVFVPIKNDTPVNVMLTSFTGKLMYGNMELSSVLMGQAVTIYGNESTVLEFSSFLNFADLAGNILDLINGGQFLQSLSLKGLLTTPELNVPIDEAIQLI